MPFSHPPAAAAQWGNPTLISLTLSPPTNSSTICVFASLFSEKISKRMIDVGQTPTPSILTLSGLREQTEMSRLGSQLALSAAPFCGCKPRCQVMAKVRERGPELGSFQALSFLRYIHGHGYDDAQEDREAPEVEEGLLGRSRVLVESREVAVLLLEHLGPEPRGHSKAQ